MEQLTYAVPCLMGVEGLVAQGGERPQRKRQLSLQRFQKRA